MRNILLFALLGLVVAGCAIPVERPTAAAYGQPPQNYEETLLLVISSSLIDPESARYEFGTPERAYFDNGYGKVTWAGYRVDVMVNAKNRMGGYSGARQWTGMFIGDSLERLLTPDDGIARGRLRSAE